MLSELKTKIQDSSIGENDVKQDVQSVVDERVHNKDHKVYAQIKLELLRSLIGIQHASREKPIPGIEEFLAVPCIEGLRKLGEEGRCHLGRW